MHRPGGLGAGGLRIVVDDGEGYLVTGSRWEWTIWLEVEEESLFTRRGFWRRRVAISIDVSIMLSALTNPFSSI